MPGIGFRPVYMVCPGCGRITATTGNARTKERYLRTHNRPKGDYAEPATAQPSGTRCPWSGRTMPRGSLQVNPGRPSRRQQRAVSLERRRAKET